MNLVAAVRTAIDPATRGLGVLVVLNDVIHSAREVTKTSTYRLETFQSPYYGILGEVDGDRISIYRHAVRKHTVDTPFRVGSGTVLPRVDIAYCYAGADSVAIDAFIAAGAKGIVAAALAPGIVTPGQRAALETAAASGVVVVQTSRAGSGRVARRKYLREKGIVAADNLIPQKARVLLMLALAQTNDAETIQRWFGEY
jgi:L-asparaginase